MDATKGVVLHKRGFKEVLSTPGKKSSSPARKQTKKAVEESENVASNCSSTLKLEIMNAINAALDSKHDQLATRIEAMAATKNRRVGKKIPECAE